VRELPQESCAAQSNISRTVAFEKRRALVAVSRPSGIMKKQPMNDTQILTIALASVPTTLAVLVGILINNSRLGDLRAHMDRRFDDMCDTWRSELHRVEEVLDARSKHLEER
jgi:hypothetical protein